jgi:hypothetical protein
MSIKLCIDKNDKKIGGTFMSIRNDLVEQVELLKTELNTAVSRSNNLEDEHLIALCQRIDDIAIRLNRGLI